MGHPSRRRRRGQPPTAFRPGGRGLELEQLESRVLLSSSSGALGVAGEFNVFVFGGITQNYTDAQGRVAAGGNARLTGYGLGDALASSAGTRDDLVVGGDLTYDQGQVFNGNVVHGGAAVLTNVGLPHGTARRGAGLDFGAAQTQLTGLSTAWAALAANGTTTDFYGTLKLTGGDPTLDVFAVSAGQLASANGLNISAPAGATVLVNVTGADARMQYFGMTVSGTDRRHVLVNFADATTLTVAGISVQGSVLAPHADVAFNNGNLEGTLVARSVAGNGEFHDYPTLVQFPAPTPPPGSLSGFVYVDANNNGRKDAGEAGIAGVKVTLTGSNDLGAVAPVTTTTGADGFYSFGNLRPGSYTVTETQPSGYLDGLDAKNNAVLPGSAGGPDVVSAVTVAANANSPNNNFGELRPGSLSGVVYVDANNDGVRQATETGIAGVKVTLTGKNDLGASVALSVFTNATGAYAFTGLRPGSYTLTEIQPSGYLDGKDTVGSQGGTTALDAIYAALGVGVQGVNNNFGEMGQTLVHGQTATIGFWQGPNGQALIQSFGTTAGGLTFAGWLATTLPKLYGKGGMHDLTGRTNADVAALFRALFAVQGQKVEAQIMATALAVFTTTNSLNTSATARALAVKHGFLLNDAGSGAALWNVGANYQAFGATANSYLSLMTLLTRTNDRVSGGKLFGGNATQTGQSNTVFSAVNQGGDIV